MMFVRLWLAYTLILASGLGGESDHVLVAAHRGGYLNDKSDAAPENSLANLELAVRKGFDVYETDLQRTKDGVFVMVHDPTLDRETDGTGSVDELSLKELKELRKRYRDGSESEKEVATFREMLVAGRGRILFKPDLKPGVIEHFDDLAKLINEMGMEEQVYLRTSLKDADRIAEYFEKGTPRVEVMFKVSRAEQVREVARRFSPATIQVNIEKGEEVTETKRAAIAEAVKLGMLVETHGYGDFEQINSLVRAGVRMLHTAVPDKTLEWLAENGWRDTDRD